MKKRFSILYTLISSIFIHSQSNTEIPELGNIYKQEIFMTQYEKDSTADALILEEICKVYPSKYKKYNYTKEYYVKIKFFSNTDLSKATIEIPYFKNSKLENIAGITYNLDENGNTIKTKLGEEYIKNTNFNNVVKGKSFAMPKVKEGSIIEYKYTISVNNYGIYDWYFQTDIPKLKTNYSAYFSSDDFKVRTIGYLTPKNISTTECKKNTMCSLIYEMDNVPAFKEEAYLTNKDNYISRLTFERSYIFDPYVKKGENREWNTIDKAIRNRYDDELDKTRFYKRELPDTILNEPNELTRAKKVFYFIQNHFTLDNNTDQYFYEAYKNKKGTIQQINLSLYNALKAANINNPNLVLLSTRANGFATKLHATVIDFNYRVVLVSIDGKKYFLDASHKHLPFGLIPFFCLNGDGRVFNQTKPSYWEPITSNSIPSNQKTIIRAKLNIEDNILEGKLKVVSNGYYAYSKRKQLALPKNSELLINSIEEKHPYVEINKSDFKNQKDVESPLLETYSVSFEDVISRGKYIKVSNLMIGSSSLENTFKMKERMYPVDFGYAKEENFRISISLPKNIEITSIPKPEGIQLPNDDASYIFKADIKNHILTINFQYNINKKVFLSNQYESLKAFYDKMVKVQNSLIEFKVKDM